MQAEYTEELMKSKGKDGNKKADIKERLCHSLDIQPDVFPYGTLIELRGRNAVCVRGAGSVSLYTDTEIRFVSREGEICVRGERLFCSAYRRGVATVDGKILSVSFEEVKK